MLKRFLMSLLFITAASAAFASSWSKAISGGQPNGATQLSDGTTLICAGQTIIKASPGGTPLLLRRFASQFAVSAISDDAGGAFIDGSGWVGRIGGDLTMKWAVAIEPPRPVMAMARMRDGGLAVSLRGKDDIDAVVIRFDAAGRVKWQKRYDTSGNNNIQTIVALPDGGLIVGGQSETALWSAALDANGNARWQQRIALGGAIQTGIAIGGGNAMLVGNAGFNGRAYVFVEIVAIHDGGIHSQQRAVESASVTAKGLLSDGSIGVMLKNESDVIAGRLDASAKFNDAIRFASQPNANLFVNGAFFAGVFDKGVTTFSQLEHDVPSCLTKLPPAEIHFTPTSFASSSTPIEVTDADVVISPLTITMQEAEMKIAACANTPVASAPATAKDEGDEALAAKAVAFRTRIEDLFASEKFDELEAIAATALSKKSELTPMLWTIDAFYDDISAPGLTARVTDDQQLELIEKWIRHSPSSATARVVKTRTLYQMAWKARGARYSDTVTASGGRSYADFMQRAEAALRDAASIAANDPHFQLISIQIGRETAGLDVLAAVQSAASKAISLELLVNPGNYLHSKWGGSPAQYQHYAEVISPLLKERYGEGLYAMFAVQALGETNAEFRKLAPDVRDPVFTTYKFSWDRVKRGFEDLIARYPDLVSTRLSYALMAFHARDRATLKRLLAMPEVANRRELIDARNWANTAEPPAIAAATTLPRVLLRSELKVAGKSFPATNAFLLAHDPRLAVVIIPDSIEGSPKLASYIRLQAFPFQLMLTPASRGGAAFRVKSMAMIVNPRVNLSAAVATIDASGAGVEALNVDKGWGLRVSRGRLVKCATATASVCREMTIDGKITATRPSAEVYTFTPDKPADLSNSVGSPVIGSDGNATCVVLSVSEGVASCESIRMLMDLSNYAPEFR